MTLGEKLRQVSAQANASAAQARADRDARNALMVQMDAGDAKLREIAAEAGLTVGHVQRIIIRHLDR